MNQSLSWRTRVALVLAVCLFTFLASPAPAQYTVVNLVSNTSTFNPVKTDPNLVNGWGLVSFPTSPFWISDQNSSNGTLYTGAGAIIPLVVHIPCLVSGSVTVPCPLRLWLANCCFESVEQCYISSKLASLSIRQGQEFLRTTALL